MLIRSLSAVFGRLQNETLSLHEGLNIIEAPNERGKSTWCAFLTAMLYGINSRERDRAGFIAGKNRYAPWNGNAMTGRMECLVNGQSISITRNTRRQTAPMAEFYAADTGSGSSVADLTGANCGEMLLGVSREVFERSAFIRQSGLAISQDDALERRIASLISSGEEDTSYAEAGEALKKQINRRRFHQSGLLPTLEADLANARQQQSAADTLRQQFQEAQNRVQALEADAEALSRELKQHDRWDAAQKKQQLKALAAAAQCAQHRVRELEAQLTADRVPDTETIGRLRGAIVNLETTRKSADRARIEKDEAMKKLLLAEKALAESPFAGQPPEEARREAEMPPKVSCSAASALAVLFAMLTAAVGIAGFAFFRCDAYLTGGARLLPYVISVTVAAAAVIISHQMRCRAVSAARNAALQKRFGTADTAQIAAMADTYIKSYEAREVAQADAAAKSATAEALCTALTTNEQGILLEVRRFAPSAFDSSTADQMLRHAAQRRKAMAEAQLAAREAAARLAASEPSFSPAEDAEETTCPQPPARNREIISAQLAQVRSELTAAQSNADRLSGQLHAIGDPAHLSDTVSALQAQIDTVQLEYDALQLAADTLNRANTALQNRFSPQLSRRTARIFEELTEGRYTAATLDRNFRLTARPAGDLIDRDIQLLSAGAADQLYLAARLAICQTVLPAEKNVPIILDDALANFDDARCSAALRWLRQEAEHRQILLFTCHSREGAFFRNDPQVHVQQL